MSDFITGLRGDLVDAADRHRRRSRLRAAKSRLIVLPRVWRPALAAGTVAATVLAALIVASSLSPSRPARPEVAAVVDIGGQPQDAVLAGGSLWVSDYSGRVIRVDAATSRVTARIDVDGNPEGIAAGAGAVWAASPDAYEEGSGSTLSRIDPRTGDLERIDVRGHVNALAVAAGGVWLLDWHLPRLQRIDPASGERTAIVDVPQPRTVAVGGARTLWALGPEGTVSSIDGNSLAVQRTPRVAGTWGDGFANALDADAGGAWVANRDADLLLRIESGRVVSRIAVGADPGPVAVGAGAVWVAYGERTALRGDYRLARIDPETDAVTATVDLDGHPPTALLVAGEKVWVIAADGTALLVTTSDD